MLCAYLENLSVGSGGRVLLKSLTLTCSRQDWPFSLYTRLVRSENGPCFVRAGLCEECTVSALYPGRRMNSELEELHQTKMHRVKPSFCVVVIYLYHNYKSNTYNDVSIFNNITIELPEMYPEDGNMRPFMNMRLAWKDLSEAQCKYLYAFRVC
jgi:hypothetical protein